MSNKEVVVNNQVGISFLGLLAIIFIVLKLTGQITWSWWWVLAPLWMPWAISGGILAVVVTISGILYLLDR